MGSSNIFSLTDSFSWKKWISFQVQSPFNVCVGGWGKDLKKVSVYISEVL